MWTYVFTQNYCGPVLVQFTFNNFLKTFIFFHSANETLMTFQYDLSHSTMQTGKTHEHSKMMKTWDAVWFVLEPCKTLSFCCHSPFELKLFKEQIHPCCSQMCYWVTCDPLSFYCCHRNERFKENVNSGRVLDPSEIQK